MKRKERKMRKTINIKIKAGREFYNFPPEKQIRILIAVIMRDYDIPPKSAPDMLRKIAFHLEEWFENFYNNKEYEEK